MSWRLARSLEKLRTQINAAYPQRSKVSDGSIGDQAHSARVSDHNPDANGVVHAIDVTNDPLGPTGQILSRQLINDPRIKYVIFAGEIWKAHTGQWEPYRGPNRHDHHVHVSVQADSADDLSPWTLSDAPPAVPGTHPTLRLHSSGPAVKELQAKLGIEMDGQFGYGTQKALLKFQEARKLTADGICGPKTWKEFGL